MPKRKSSRFPPPEGLVARIDSHRLSYYASQPQERDPPFFDDEALIDISATIERVSERHRAYVGQTLEITLACARTYKPGDLSASQDTPSLFSMTLKQAQRSCLGYLPSEAFWPIPLLIENGTYTHVETRFTPLSRGHGELLGIWLGTRAGLDAIQKSTSGHF